MNNIIINFSAIKFKVLDNISHKRKNLNNVIKA